MRRIKYSIYRKICLFLVINLLGQILIPLRALALTSGPSQPEVQSFEPVGTSQMVDLFSGDFTYNIPLFELPGSSGGYPFNMHYNSNVTMDQEASWVGLGWNLNPGVLNRQMRGLPDDFNSDLIKKENDIRPNTTFGVGVGGSAEIFGGDVIKGKLSLGISIYYNNYKGVGYSVDPGLSLSTTSKGSFDAGLGFNFSLDSQEGVGVNPSLSLPSLKMFNDNKFSVGASYNSRRGLYGASMGVSASSRGKMKVKDKEGKNIGERQGTKVFGSSSNVSFSSQAYSPQITSPMQGRNVSLTVKMGGSLFGVFGNAYYNGFFNTQYLKDNTTWNKGYGYFNLENAGKDGVLDFNREKDGQIRKSSPNLPAPVMTYDVYNVTGQGVSGMFKPFRSDVGTVYDKYSESITVGGSGGFDAGIGMPHIGADLSINYSKNTSGKWDNGNTGYKFVSKESTGNVLHEPFYFKNQGDKTTDTIRDLDYTGGAEAVSVALAESGNFLDRNYDPSKTLKGKSGKITSGNAMANIDPNSGLSSVNDLDKREPRTVVLTPVKNSDIMASQNGSEALKEFKITYFTSSSINSFKDNNTSTFSRSRKMHHVAGYSTVNPDGTRYVYALPAYNNKEIECQFSVKPQPSCSSIVQIDKASVNSDKPTYNSASYDNTDKYYSRTTTPEYAHSYLLTSVLGTDYIDADNIAGPSAGDFGYWVKFSYVKTSSAYKWRVPFTGAMYNKGYKTTPWDDKGAYTFGEKEIWYLAKAETKTHVSTFEISQRPDSKGANLELQNSNDPTLHGESTYKLDKINLFTRSEFEKASGSLPLKVVRFEYTYDLCGDVPNNSGITISNGSRNINSNKGKLTLKKVWFEEGLTARGRLSPYEFDYNESNTSENPNYNTHKYDRWGNYKSYDENGNKCDNLDIPYVNQDPLLSTRNQDVAVWNLKAITLPSGGTIKVKYESDDYGFVQNKTAMQMFKIKSLSSQNVVAGSDSAIGTGRKIYFDLEQPVQKALTDAAAKSLLTKKYLDGTGKVFYKVFMNLRKPGEDFIKDYVAGYADIKSCGIDRNSGDPINATRGFIELNNAQVGSKTFPYHPFSVAAWQHIRTNQPEFLGVGNYKSDPNTNEGQRMEKVKSLINLAGDISNMFSGYYNRAFSNNWGSEIDLNKSFIRLNSSDKIKYGGGLRVKEISLDDDWSNQTSGLENSSIYGQVYDYSIVEEGQTISSGVATFEPSIGGEENALKIAKTFTESIPFLTDNNLYFEYPINESYYPSPSVGYRKVTVKSLATHYESPLIANDPYNIPQGILTTGAIENEFYTAKDFPVISNETDIDKKSFDLFIPIPFLGQITANHLTSSQGYCIELNDMHGKPKRVSNFQQDGLGNLIPEPVSWIKYNYQSKFHPSSASRSDDYYTLIDTVSTLLADNGKVIKSKRVLGRDFEFFSDMRESRTFSTVGGLALNTDIIVLAFFILPAFVPWPNVGTSTTQNRSIVTNKIIHRSGILKSIEAYDGGSLVKTENKIFDALTGEPVLTTVTNNFDDPIFNYKLPSHLVHDGMGPSYKNIGLTFSTPLTVKDATRKQYKADALSIVAAEKHLVPGDEFVISSQGLIEKAIFLTKENNDLIFQLENTIPNNTYNFLLTRSGRKNNITEISSTIAALQNPTENRVKQTCSASVPVVNFVPEVKDTANVYPCSVGLIGAMNEFLSMSTTFGFMAYFNTYPLNQYGYCTTTQSVSYYALERLSDMIVFRQGNNGFGTIFKNSNGITILINNLKNIVNPRYSSTPPIINTSYNKVCVDAVFNDNHVEKLWLYGVAPIYVGSPYSAPTGNMTPSFSNQSVTGDIYTTDKVINASSTRFNNSWGYDVFNSSTKSISSDVLNNPSNSFWRKEEDNIFVNLRSQSTNVNLRQDGLINAVPLYDYVSSIFKSCSPAWITKSTVTNYNVEGMGVEEKDILGNSSSALFSFGGKITSAISSNSSKSEIGFESFEEFLPNSVINSDNTGTGNLQIYTTLPSSSVSTTETVTFQGKGTTLLLDRPYSSVITINEATLKGNKIFGGRIGGTYKIASYGRAFGLANKSVITLEPIPTLNNIPWKGTALLKITTTQSTPIVSFSTAGNTQIISTKAHSGKQSLSITGKAEFEQKGLNLLQGKQYVISAWVNSTTANQSTFKSPSDVVTSDRLSIIVKFYNENKVLISSSDLIEPSGSVIEGWQKIEGVITPPAFTNSIALTFTSGRLNSSGSYQVSNFDDIRIHPYQAGFTSYVYTAKDLKLSAILDDNNFALHYFYDESGELYLKQKETEKGLITLQEIFYNQKKH